MLRDLGGEVARHQIDVVGEIGPGTGDAFDSGLAAEPPFRADFAGDAGHFGGEAAQLIDHRVDRIAQLEYLAAGLDGDLAAQVTLGDGGGYFGDVAQLQGEIPGHEIGRCRSTRPTCR